MTAVDKNAVTLWINEQDREANSNANLKKVNHYTECKSI